MAQSITRKVAQGETQGARPAAEAPAKFVAYHRVSTAKQGRSGLGLEAQRAAVAAYLNGGSWDLISEFTEVESGKNTERPELQKALEFAELTNATLVVAKLDRLSRDAEFLHRLLKHRVRICFADMPFADKVIIGVMASLAEWEREQISKRTKAALSVAKARGRNVGGDRGNLAAVYRKGLQRSVEARSAASSDRADKIRPHIEQAKAEGHSSLREIAGYLNAKGITTSRGKEWQPSQVQRIIRR